MAESNSTPLKKCANCKHEKALAEFSKNNALKCGLSSQCKLCHKAKLAAYSKSHSARSLEELAALKADRLSKSCSKCRNEKSISEFYSNKCAKDGLHNQCKTCSLADQKEAYQKRKEQISVKGKALYASDPEKFITRSKAWREANYDQWRKQRLEWYAANIEEIRTKREAFYDANIVRLRARGKAFRDANPEKIAAQNSRTRKIREAVPGSFTADDVKKLMQLQRGKCPVCKKDIRAKFHVDHVVPIARGGTNDKSNLQLLCPSCNHKKSSIHPIVFMQRRGFLL